MLNLKFFILTRGVAPRFARRLPLAIISRAFGAAETDSLPTVTSEANNVALLTISVDFRGGLQGKWAVVSPGTQPQTRRVLDSLN